MATLFTSKTDEKEGLYLKKASLLQYRPVSNNTQSSQRRLRSSAKTHVEDEVDHAKRQTYSTISDDEKIRVWPRKQFYDGSDRKLGNQEFVVTAPLNTQCFRHDQAWTWSYSQSESPLNEQPSLYRLSKVDRYLKPNSHSNFNSSTPPPPSDLEALRKTWEQVRVYNSNISKPASARIKWTVQLDSRDLWKDLKDTADRKLGGVQQSLQDAGIWLLPETKDEKSKIESQLKALKKGKLRKKEARWSSHFWQRFFFKVSDNPQFLETCLEERQTHTLNRITTALELNPNHNFSSSTQKTEEEPPENRYPPILPNEEPRNSVAVSETPYDVDPDRLRNGYVFSDISYAAKIDKAVSQRELSLIERFPTIRLYEDATHYLEETKIEVKALVNERWLGDQPYKFAVRYLTLTAMTMLHEYLKLCYMSLKDENFFPMPEALTIHLIAAVGYTASHFIHRIRRKTGPVKYESYWIAEFNLGKADERDRFRETLNDIHVLHVTVFKEAMKKKVEEILALGEPEIDRRLKERAHKGVRFEYTVRDDIEGIIVKRDGKNPPLPIFASQALTFEEFTENGKRRCQAQTKTNRQCPYAALEGESSCGIPRHKESMKTRKF